MKRLLGITLLVGAVALVVMVGVMVVARRGSDGPYWLYFDADDGYPRYRGASMYRSMVDGSHVQEIATGLGYYGCQGDTGRCGVISMSPNGQWLAIRTEQIFEVVSLINTEDGGIRHITPEDSVSYFEAWTSDGQWVIFSRHGATFSHLYRVRPDNSHLEQLTSPPRGYDKLITLSPDGSWLFYIHSEMDRQWLYRMRVDGTDRQVIFGPVDHIAVPRLNTEHNRILVGVYEDEISGDYLIQTTFPFEIQRMTDDAILQSLHSLSWSPDGRWVVAGMMSVNCGGVTAFDLQALVPHEIRAGDLLDNNDCLRLGGWSPDGRWIIFYSHDFQISAGVIFRSSPDGADVERIFEGDFGSTRTATVKTWSPNGQWLILRLVQSPYVYLGRMRIDGSNLEYLNTQNLVDPWGFQERFQTWSPDGEWLIFRRDAFDGDVALYRMRVDGSGMEQITHVPGNEQFIAWSPHPTSLPWNPVVLLGGGVLGVWGVAVWRSRLNLRHPRLS